MALPTKQRTLFQTWKKEFKTIKPENKPPLNEVIELSSEEVDDDDLLSATVALENQKNPNISSVRNEFDAFAGKLWIYPTNYPMRNYQYSIVHKALFENTLVALPTGLGKTFIASVVIYNYYRWFPERKIVFMAPTKPLVSQQIEACYNIMGIPMEDQVQITGSTMASNRREELWNSKRVFFLTPQVINNDLTKGVCPAKQIKCLVIDEAHKALGNHAYCQVVQQLLAYTRDFRVLALSATPGSDLKSVQQVLTNLLISHIEIRGEDSLDIQQYIHSKKVEKIVVKLDSKILSLKERYTSVIQLFVNNLGKNKAMFNKDVTFLSKYSLLMSRDQFRQDPPSGLSKQTVGIVEGDFAISISLLHGLELLLQHGMKSFFIFLKGIVEGSKGNMRSKAILQTNSTFISIYEELTEMYGSSPSSVVLLTQAGESQQLPRDNVQGHASAYVYGHPKMKQLEDVVLKHFKTFNNQESTQGLETRVMIFCQYRDTVREITELLQKHRPLVRPMQFVGHAPSTNPVDNQSTGNKSNRRFTQKDQLMVVNKFRNGEYNTLIATCVGEEGLDIGDVDLIVCFDSHKSPIRLVQRMGRTGRKRAGKVVMLLTEGKEERDYNSSVVSRKSIHKAITGAGKNLQYYSHNPRMIPPGIKPTCHKMFITVFPKKCIGTKVKEKKKSRSVADVSMMLKQAVENSNKKTLLSEAQREYWKTKCCSSLHDKLSVKKLPQLGKMFSLNKELIQLKENQNNISLFEWLPWQQRLQQTKFVGHSSQSEILSEILNFCENLKHGQTANDDKKKFKLAKKMKMESEEVGECFEQQTDLGKKVQPICTIDIPQHKQHKSTETVKESKITSIFDNLSAIFPLSLNCKTDEKIENVGEKEVQISTPPLIDSSLFDFLDNFPKQSEVKKKRSCFQIWDNEEMHSDKKFGDSCDEVDDFKVNLNNFTNEENILKHDEKMSPHNLQQHTKREKKCLFLKNSDGSENVNKGSQKKLGRMLTSSKQSVNDKNSNLETEETFCPNSSIKMQSNKEIKSSGFEFFNMSADMFNPQFDLNFELGCEDFSAKSKISLAGNENISAYSVTHNASQSCQSQVNPRSCENTSNNSINISQYQRRKNQELFADLSVYVDHTVPVATVKPHRAAFESSTDNHVSKKTNQNPLKRQSSLKRRRNLVVPNSSDDDDFVILPKKKCSGLPRDKNNESTTSCEITPVRKQQRKKMHFLSSDCESMSEAGSPVLEKFDVSKKPESMKSHLPVLKHSTPKLELFGHKKKASKYEPNPLSFIDNEADVSGEILSSDEITDDEFDEDLVKFVNDATQLTQHVKADESIPDEREMYLRSVKSPSANIKGKYKLAYGKGVGIDVYSQVVEESDSEYFEDSFVVPNDQTEVCEDFGEITILSQNQFPSPDNWERNRPKTRREVKLQNAMKLKSKPVMKKGRKILVCDDDSDATDIDEAITCGTKPECVEKLKCAKDIKLTRSWERFCKVCGCVLTSKGWVCQDCLDKLGEEQNCGNNNVASTSNTTQTKQISENLSTTKLGRESHSISTRAERLMQSKLKQQKLREKQKEKINASHQKSFLDQEKSHQSSASDAVNVSFSPRLIPIKMQNLDDSLIALSTHHDKKNKLVVMIDNREASGVGRLVQRLRTKHDVNVLVAPLHSCHFLISRRTAMFRKSAADLSTVSSRNKLTSVINLAKHFYSKTYLLVEKDRPKPNKLGWSSTSQLNNYMLNLVTISNRSVKVLFSDNQEDSADIIYTVARRESDCGEEIDESVVASASSAHSRNLFNVCSSFPGVSYLSAKYLSQNFKSIQHICISSVDEIVKGGSLSTKNAENLRKFFAKMFDLQMIPE